MNMNMWAWERCCCCVAKCMHLQHVFEDLLQVTRLAGAMLFALAVASAGVASPLAWVVESEQYAERVRQAATGWRVEWCGANGTRCTAEKEAVRAVVGRADAVDLGALPSLDLVQSPSWFKIPGVPARAALTNFDIWPAQYWHPYSVANIGEFVVAAIFDDLYRFGARSKTMGCAFADDSPARCPSASAATNHPTVSALTVGVLGYGRIGEQVCHISKCAVGHK